MQRFTAMLVALLMASSLTMAGAKRLAPGPYVVPPCPAPDMQSCAPFMPTCQVCTAPNEWTCKPFFPVVEQTICPAATVLPQPGLLLDHSGDAGAAVGADGAQLVAPVAEKKKLKEWQKRTLYAVGFVALGTIIEHQFDNDDTGDNRHRHGRHNCDGYYCED
jgi:hypothetical protein